MDARARERLIGALILVGLVVLLVPAILKGRSPEPAVESDEAGRSVVMSVEDEPAAPREDVLIPEPQPQPQLPSGEPAARSPRAPPALESAADATTGSAAWAVQLGAFSSRDKADALVGQLRERGYAAFVLEYRADGKLLYRVRVGPEQDRAHAREIASRLEKDGFQPVVARHP